MSYVSYVYSNSQVNNKSFHMQFSQVLLMKNEWSIHIYWLAYYTCMCGFFFNIYLMKWLPYRGLEEESIRFYL